MPPIKRTRKAATTRTSRGPRAIRAKKAALLQQLDAAGVQLVHADPAKPADLVRPELGTRLTAAALRDIKNIDFTAWGAWTLRF